KRSHASVDRTQIRQLLVNLITNGLQASKGRVDVSVETDRAMLIFEVCDEGEGIPKELLSRIFEPLFTTKHRGLGLGLALCLRIAEAHQGWIHVDGGGASEGRGATFRVYLPDAVLQPGL
ncbi:MAG: ATP-binding protein, partial [Myxococcota bacterium]